MIREPVTTELQSGKDKVAVEIPDTASGIKTEKFELKRDFKISGQIGEAGQQEKLTYVTLIHQIDLGLTKGYKELEVVEAVIKAISPHSNLRNYVLTLPNRSLEKLRKILRMFFQEKTSAELYQDLVTCQQPKESAQQFLLRLLDSRNKVLFASQEEGSQFEYSQKLVQNTFIKSLETGLRDETLVTNLRPTLQGTEVSDESLMRIVNDLASKQAGRKLKMASAAGQQRTLKVNLAQTEAEKTDHAATKRKPKTGSDQSVNEKLLAEIQEIKTDIHHLKDQVHKKQQANRYRKPPRMSRPRGGPTTPHGCKQCQSQGNLDCRHCFKCGAYGQC